MQLSEFDFELPKECIAQFPAPKRDAARLMVLDPVKQTWTHSRVSAIGDFLGSDDLLVFNDTQVMLCRFLSLRETGGRVWITLLGASNTEPDTWEALLDTSRRPRPGETLKIADTSIEAVLLERTESGPWKLRFPKGLNVKEMMAKQGYAPLPPYIKRKKANQAVHKQDRQRYQTIYAAREGAVAAPTAGLHFTDDLIERLENHGVSTARLTLHVGPGTFTPIKTSCLQEHHMAGEYYEISCQTIGRINETRKNKGRVIPVGTTSTRAMEHAFPFPEKGSAKGSADNFIYPGYAFCAAGGLMTNFHLPKSTPLLLTAAMAGWDFLLKAYTEAIQEGYRFFSYGDAMLILPSTHSG